MKYIEFTGKSINEAVDKAHDELSLDYNDLHWEVIDEPSKGFLGIVGAKPARIRVEIEEEEDKKPVENPKNVKSRKSMNIRRKAGEPRRNTKSPSQRLKNRKSLRQSLRSRQKRRL